jgi:hypothetical protein
VVLGGRLFANRSRLRTHIQLLLQLLDGQEVAPGHPDFAFLRSLLERHPRYKAKVGGADRADVRSLDGGPWRSMCLPCVPAPSQHVPSRMFLKMPCPARLLGGDLPCPVSAAQVRAPVRGFRVRLVEQPDMPPFRHFEYQDSDGAWEDFSYRKCIGWASWLAGATMQQGGAVGA